MQRYENGRRGKNIKEPVSEVQHPRNWSSKENKEIITGNNFKKISRTERQKFPDWKIPWNAHHKNRLTPPHMALTSENTMNWENMSDMKKWGSEKLQTSKQQHWKLAYNGTIPSKFRREMLFNQEICHQPNQKKKKKKIEGRKKIFSGMKCLKNFDHLRKLLEEVFHQSRRVNKKADGVAGEGERASPGRWWAWRATCLEWTAEASLGWQIRYGTWSWEET